VTPNGLPGRMQQLVQFWTLHGVLKDRVASFEA
jgi:hypothetical protein